MQASMHEFATSVMRHNNQLMGVINILAETSDSCSHLVGGLGNDDRVESFARAYTALHSTLGLAPIAIRNDNIFREESIKSLNENECRWPINAVPMKTPGTLRLMRPHVPSRHVGEGERMTLISTLSRVFTFEDGSDAFEIGTPSDYTGIMYGSDPTTEGSRMGPFGEENTARMTNCRESFDCSWNSLRPCHHHLCRNLDQKKDLQERRSTDDNFSPGASSLAVFFLAAFSLYSIGFTPSSSPSHCKRLTECHGPSDRRFPVANTNPLYIQRFWRSLSPPPPVIVSDLQRAIDQVMEDFQSQV
ncbi:hypothetical protein FQN54_004010 [Arachnomyces sp. PD_36]|nr:hypothetical protein FQN54_004010 [Arachnomyces sp. PD_36]